MKKGLHVPHWPDHPRVDAARSWLAQHARFDEQPGDFPAARAIERDSSYYYWCWSFAHSMRLLGASTLDTPSGSLSWAEPLADALLARQRADGSWSNPCTMVLEDDPLVATPFAAGALGLASWFLTASSHERGVATP